MESAMAGVLVKKKDLTDITPMVYLQYLCENAKKGNWNADRIRKIIAQRIIALEDASIIYIDTDVDDSNYDMVQHAVDEIEILTEILKAK